MPRQMVEEAGIGTFLGVILIMAILAVLAVMLLRGRDVVEVGMAEPDEVERRTVSEAVQAGRAAVLDVAITDPREAIVACFAAMEDALSGMGEAVAPRQEDTSEEVLRRGVQAGVLAPEHGRTLLGLFREARYSTHPMTETDRETAARALTDALERVEQRR